MNKLVLLGVLALVSASMALTSQEYLTMFNEFKGQFNKKYASPVEEQQRFAAFQTNLDFINQHNAEYEAGKQTYTVGINQFADLTRAEFKAMYLRPFNSTRPKNVVILPEVPNGGSVDWRTKGAVTPVKDQGQCGSCWAFSTTGSTEGANVVAGGSLISLSEQQLVDCSGSEGNQGCNGGLMDYAFQYIIKNGGLTTESNYGYTARDGTCNTQKQADHAVSIKSFNDVQQGSEAQLLAAVTQQPVSVAIEADQSGFQFYKSGIFTGPCGTQLDHGVLAVGYGTQGSTDYWIVKNSWGVSWGSQGYILMGRGIGATGLCGIAAEPSYPIGTGSGPAPPSPPSPPSPSPPSPPSPASHYEDPKPNGCRSDELSVQVTGLDGDFCSPYCSIFKPCPKDVPTGTTARPECVLETAGSSSPTNCALICTPSGNDECPSGASCKAIQGTGVCTYDD